MRISDWSSDVCSSDLSRSCALREHVGEMQVALGSRMAQTTRGPSKSTALKLPNSLTCSRSEERRVGKSVSVRVDLGGRRIIQKKKQIDANITVSNTRHHENYNTV